MQSCRIGGIGCATLAKTVHPAMLVSSMDEGHPGYKVSFRRNKISILQTSPLTVTPVTVTFRLQ